MAQGRTSAVGRPLLGRAGADPPPPSSLLRPVAPTPDHQGSSSGQSSPRAEGIADNPAHPAHHVRAVAATRAAAATMRAVLGTAGDLALQGREGCGGGVGRGGRRLHGSGC